jgi:membrane protease YdiL (CAAX protease family)
MTQPPGDESADLYGADSPFLRLPKLTPAGALVRQLAVYAASGLVVAVVASLQRGGLPLIGFRLTLGDLGWSVAGVAAFLAYNLVSAVVVSALPGGRALLRWLRRRNLAMFGGMPPGLLLVMAALAGVCEEIVFRGWLQPILGLSSASFVFAVVHFPPNRYKWSHPVTWGMVALYFPVGLGIGWLYLWRGNLLAPVITHAVGDSLGLLALLQQARRSAGAAPPA